VLQLITKYLLQYRKVSIPHIGTFRIRTLSPRLDVADKRIGAPAFTTEYSSFDSVSEHQFTYLARVQQSDRERISQELSSFGQQLKENIKGRPLAWKGFGILKGSERDIIFEPEEIRLQALQPVIAAKVIRLNAPHRVRQGEDEISSHQKSGTGQKKSTYKKSRLHVIAWILLVLALLAILFILYQGQFDPAASGLKKRVMAPFLSIPVQYFASSL
jgi:hypothetical protein